MSEAKLAQILMIFITVLCVIFQTWTSESEEVLWRSIVLLPSVLIDVILFITKSDCGKVPYAFMRSWPSLSVLGSVSYDLSIRLITRLLC
jgi:hypothetical protein